MPQAFAVYVSATAPGPRNLQAGLENLVWGWRESVLDRRNRRENRTNREIVRDIRPGDLLVMGTNGPNTRVVEGEWADATLGRVLFLRFTSALQQGQTPVWPDEVAAGAVLYPNRVSFEVIYDVRPPEVAALEPEVLEALRWSANTQGSATPIHLAGQRAPRVSIADAPNGNAGRLDHEGEFDALAHVLVRREQRKIRAQKFGNRAELQCALCSKTYPARLVRAAHIKRRSDCSPDELLDLNNIMAACALGCDEMFEHGYVAVDDAGEVIAHRPAIGDLATAVTRLAGGRCVAHAASSRDYFTWHRDDHAARFMQRV